jgi:hypothetical protein
MPLIQETGPFNGGTTEVSFGRLDHPALIRAIRPIRGQNCRSCASDGIWLGDSCATGCASAEFLVFSGSRRLGTARGTPFSVFGQCALRRGAAQPKLEKLVPNACSFVFFTVIST